MFLCTVLPVCNKRILLIMKSFLKKNYIKMYHNNNKSSSNYIKYDIKEKGSTSQRAYNVQFFMGYFPTILKPMLFLPAIKVHTKV